MSEPPIRVKQVDWVSTTARWGLAIVLILFFGGLLVRACFGPVP